MDSLAVAPARTKLPLANLPAWALPRGREPTEADAAFAAGIALKSLDDLVRSYPAWAGCWHSRQALRCAAAAVRLMGRTEDEHALRYAVLLTAAGGDPGPAGKVVLAYKKHWCMNKNSTICAYPFAIETSLIEAACHISTTPAVVIT